MEFLVWFDKLGIKDVPRVGGKNASLGEMISALSLKGVHIPAGFATTAEAYRYFLQQDGLDQRIYQLLDSLDIEDVTALGKAGAQIRDSIMAAQFPASWIIGLAVSS